MGSGCTYVLGGAKQGKEGNITGVKVGLLLNQLPPFDGMYTLRYRGNIALCQEIMDRQRNNLVSYRTTSNLKRSGFLA